MTRSQEEFNNWVAAELRVSDKRMDKLVEEVADIKANMIKIEALIQNDAKAVAHIKADTADMLVTFESWRGAMRTLEMIGKLAKPVSYIIGLLASIAAFYTAIKAGVGTK